MKHLTDSYGLPAEGHRDLVRRWRLKLATLLLTSRELTVKVVAKRVGYRNAEALIKDTTVVFNGDVLTDIDLNDVIRFHKEKAAVATLVLAPVPNPTAYGLVETADDGRIQRFIEKPKPEEVTCNTINAGIYVLEPRVLDYVPDGEPL